MHLAERMVAEGLDVHVAAGGGFIHGPASVMFHRLDVERFKFSFKDSLLFWQLRSLVARLKPDIVHIITMKPAVIASLALATPIGATHRPQRIVVTFPGLGRLFEHGGLWQRLRWQVSEFFLRRLLGLSSTRATFENSSDAATFIDRRLISADKVKLTNGAGLDLERFRTAGRDVSHRPFRALWAARLLRSKGVFEFVQAAELSRSSGSPTEFWIAGYPDHGHSDALTESEIAAIAENPAIRYCGHVTDMPELLAQVDALILPSRYKEGLPRILIEASAARLVLVGSDIAGIQQIIRNGETGLLLADVSAASIASSIESLVRDPSAARAMADAAHDLVWDAGFHEEAVQLAFLSTYGLNPRDALD